MMRMWLNIVLAMAAAVLSGCAVHQWPEPKSNSMVLYLHYEPDFWVWEHLYDPVQGLVEERWPDAAVDEEHPGTTERYSGACDHGSMRIIIRAFSPRNLDKCLREYVFTRDVAGGYDCSVELDLEAGEYVLLIWSDLFEDPADEALYDTEDFRRVMLRYRENYCANTDFRDAYRGRVSVMLNRSIEHTEAEQYSVTMRRPLSKFEFVTTDLSEFLESETTRRHLSSRADIKDYLIEIQYSAYLPSSYSVVEDRLENSATGVKFASEAKISGESEASLGFDYVFINDIPKGGVLTEISVYDMEGERVAHSHQITVPLRRDHHTILRGAFLTMNAKGGVGIDPGYDGDHNIEFN